jgi:hypothetical protein
LAFNVSNVMSYLPFGSGVFQATQWPELAGSACWAGLPQCGH